MRSVLGTSYFLSMDTVVDLVKSQLVCSELDKAFILYFDPPDKGLPTGVNFDNYFFTVPSGVPSNVSPLSSPLKYNASHSTTTPVSQTTHSNDLIFTDNYFKGYVSRELIYHLPQPKYSTWHASWIINTLLARVFPSTYMHVQLRSNINIYYFYLFSFILLTVVISLIIIMLLMLVVT